MDEREAKLPSWCRSLLADLRTKVERGNDPLLRELNQLRPQVKLFKTRCEAMQELLDCAAKGGHMTANEIMAIIKAYDLQLIPQE